MRWTGMPVVGALLAVAVACTGSSADPDRAAPDDNGSCSPATHEALTAWHKAGFAGSIAILSAGRPECTAGFGVADDQTGRHNEAATVYSIGSVSKAVTAAAVFRLVDDGRLSLDDRAGAFLPELDGPAADATLEQLLLHTSGLHGEHGVDDEPLTREEAVAAISDLDRAAPPGTAFLYSNAGYSLLALIVEAATGVDYRQYLVSDVLRVDGARIGGFWDGEPAADGPRSVGYHDDGTPGADGTFRGPHWATTGNGDVAMSMPELAEWVNSMFTGRLLSASSTEALTETRFERDDGTAVTPGWVAFDASDFGEPMLATAGGGGDVGHNVAVAWLPEQERVVAIASNRPEILAEVLLRRIGPALIAGDPLPRPPTADERVTPEDLEAVGGHYELANGGRFDVEPSAGGLAVAALDPDSFAALFPLPAHIHETEATAHEANVRALLAGQTEAGREELGAIEDELGSIGAMEILGTRPAPEGELRTHVTLTAGDRTIHAWYSLDDAGGVAGAEVATDAPTLQLVAAGPRRFRPFDPAGTGPDVEIRFGDATMTVHGPSETVEATRS